MSSMPNWSRELFALRPKGWLTVYTGWSSRKSEYFRWWWYRSLRKQKFIWTCIWFWLVTEIELFESPHLTPTDFCLWGSILSEVYTRKEETRQSILDAAARIKKREDQLRRTTRDLRTRVAKFTAVEGGVLEHLLWTVTNLLFMCNRL